ncbi:MAG: glutamate decarboxylase [Acidimicrobiaceae bacterium]|jgi:glutamate decarboxylase|nr:glutamate decarboxylase [Acidimicrobiaceae bacterium]
MALHAHETGRAAQEALDILPQFAFLGAVGEIPKLRIPPGGMPATLAYEIIHDELLLDGNARLNLATFVTTWMEGEAEKLMAECAAKNMIDKDEYPQTAELEHRCVNIIASLWHAEETDGATGCSTIGSSEACMLGGMALKWRWRERRRAAGASVDRPNLVMGANVQVCWEKFCRYWDVEARIVPVGPVATCLTAQGAAAHCDENTIGVVAVLGSTYDGLYEPVAEIAAALDGLARDRGIDVPIHVDAASGGFIAPFLDPDLLWDFRLRRVQSINVSGHKYGLVYPGIGWVIWRDNAALPEELVFKVDYLGGQMPTFGLNFSRPGAQVVGQYYNFIRLGADGYRAVQQTCRDTAEWLAQEIAGLAPFELVSNGDGIPAFAFRIGEAPFTVYEVSETLRGRGWLVPAYRMPPALDEVAVLRVVVRNGFSRDLAELLLDDLTRTVARLHANHPDPATKVGFHH